MTALEYMERQLNKHRMNHEREFNRGAPEEVLANIRAKINHYEAAVEALREQEEYEILKNSYAQLQEIFDGTYASNMAMGEELRKRKWISVEERLPDVGVTVLTLDKWGHINSRYMYKRKDGTVLFTAEHLVSSKDVTHWMPLPEPPKEEV